MKHTVYLSQINHLKFKIVFNFGVVNSYRIIAITNKKNCVTLKQLRQKKKFQQFRQWFTSIKTVYRKPTFYTPSIFRLFPEPWDPFARCTTTGGNESLANKRCASVWTVKELFNWLSLRKLRFPTRRIIHRIRNCGYDCILFFFYFYYYFCTCSWGRFRPQIKTVSSQLSQFIGGGLLVMFQRRRTVMRKTFWFTDPSNKRQTSEKSIIISRLDVKS